MKVCRYRHSGQVHLGVVLEDGVVSVKALYESAGLGTEAPSTLVELMSDRARLRDLVNNYTPQGNRNRVAPLPTDAVEFLAPIEHPGKILCVARNYVEHVREFDKALQRQQSTIDKVFLFLKPGTAVTGPNGPVVVSNEAVQLDYECELAVIIGRGGRYIPEDKALEHVGGYTIMNDLSDRGHLPRGNDGSRRIDWFAMKGQDMFAPLGPWVRLAEDVPDPHDLQIRLWVNGELRQNASTAEMVFKIPEIIAHASRLCTLYPGDIISTGSPAGNAPAWGAWLKHGDVIEGEITGMGRQRFEIQVEQPAYRVVTPTNVAVS